MTVWLAWRSLADSACGACLLSTEPTTLQALPANTRCQLWWGPGLHKPAGIECGSKQNDCMDPESAAGAAES